MLLYYVLEIAQECKSWGSCLICCFSCSSSRDRDWEGKSLFLDGKGTLDIGYPTGTGSAARSIYSTPPTQGLQSSPRPHVWLLC